MTSSKIAFFLIALVCVAACTNEKTPEVEIATGAPSLPFDSHVVSESDHRPSTSRPSATAMTASAVLDAEHAALLALSVEEAAWLDRHGYPTPQELQALSTYDVELLEDAMRNRRDPKAAALLGHRMLLDGDVDGALYAFAAGSELGSLYARQQMALTSTQRVTGLPRESLPQADQGNLQVMVAQLEVAKLLGDHRAQDYIDRYASTLDWKHYGKHVMTQTVEFMRQYGEGARARGERPLGPDPRPNADAWSRLSSDPNAPVTVYRRDGTGH